jgi:hypothetical protein
LIASSDRKPGVHHVRHGKLAYAPEPLKHRSLNDFGLVARQTNEAMYRVPYLSLFTHGSEHFGKRSCEQYSEFRHTRTRGEIA